MTDPRGEALQQLNSARLAALAGQTAATRWCPNLRGDFSSVLMHLDAALESFQSATPEVDSTKVAELKRQLAAEREHGGLLQNQVDAFLRPLRSQRSVPREAW
jgi:hypothetical protein